MVDSGDGGALGTPAEYEALRNRLVRYLMARGLQRDTAENLAQDTLLTLEGRARSGRNHYSDDYLVFAAIKTASNKLLNYRKKKSTTLEVTGQDGVDAAAGQASDPYSSALHGALREAIRRIERDCQFLIFLKFYKGMSSREIAEIWMRERSIPRTENAINIQSTRCIKSLREAFLAGRPRVETQP